MYWLGTHRWCPWALCKCHDRLSLSSFIPTLFLLLLCYILLPCVLGNVCLLQREACVGFWACITFFFSSLHGMRIIQIRASSHVAHWVPILAISLLFHGPVGHVGPLGSLALSLVFPDPLVSFLPLILPMGQLAVIPAMLAHWTCYLFSWASSAHLLHLYLSFFP